jgi:hypothetical protein
LAIDKRTAVLRILDDQNRLIERADTKAISLLSTLGIFTAFFVAQFHAIPITPVSFVLIGVYFASALLSVAHIILAISPRIKSTGKGAPGADETKVYQPTFYAGICSFPDSVAYNKCLDEMLNEEEATTSTYVEQVYAVAKINDTKYKYVKRAVVLVVITLTAQLSLIAFTYATVVTAPK